VWFAASFALAQSPAPQEPPRPQLTLERAIELAVTRNERPLAAQQRLVAAEATLYGARAFFFPSLSLSGAYTRRMYESIRTVDGQNYVVQAINALNGAANLRIPVFDARGFPLLSQAKHNRDAAEDDAAETGRQVAFQTAEAYFAALSAEQVALAAQQRLQLADANLKDAEARFQAKLVSSNDVTKARLELATAQRELTLAEGNRDTAYLALSYLIDEEVRPPLAEPERILAEASAAPTDVTGEIIARAISQRPDLRAGRERVQGLQAFAQEPRMRLLPALDIAGQYRVTNEAGLTNHYTDGFVALELNWTLFDNGTRYADLRQRDALARAAVLDQQGAERKVGVDLQTARAFVASARAALTAAKVAADAADQNANEISTLYRQGLTSALDTANAGVSRFDAHVALARERYGLALAFLDLRAALGQDPLGREVKP